MLFAGRGLSSKLRRVLVLCVPLTPLLCVFYYAEDGCAVSPVMLENFEPGASIMPQGFRVKGLRVSGLSECG